MNNRYLLFLLFVLALLPGCKQDFNLTAPYKEEMVIYGLLSQQDNPWHYVRIQKGFLLQGNAYLAAGVTDSIYYPNILKVTISGTALGVHDLERVNGDSAGLTEGSGIFANVPNYLYRFKFNLVNGSDTIRVLNTVTNNSVWAATTLINTGSGGFAVTNPPPNPPSPTKIALSNSSPFLAAWAPGNASIFDLTVRFYYREYATGSNTLLKDSFIDIPALRSLPVNTATTNMNQPITEDNVVKFLASHLAIDPNIYRQFVKMDFNFAAGGPELGKFLTSQYAQFNSLASSDALPPYTNINGGLGLFSSRYSTSISGVLLSTAGVDSLACGSDAGGLRFKGSVGQICY